MPLYNPTIATVPDPLIKTTITGTNISGSNIRATSFTGSFNGSYIGDGSGITGVTATIPDPFTRTTITGTNITGSDIKTTFLTASNVTGSDAKFTSITASFSGNGSGLTNLTASQISAFQNDVRAQLSAGTGIGFSSGIISNTGIVSIVAGDNIGVSTNTVSLSSSLSNLTAVTSSNITGSDIKTTTLSASNITGSDAKLTSVTASFSGNGAGIISLDAGNISAGTLLVARGGTGAVTFTANALLTGNTTSAFGTITPTSNSGSALISNGTNWIAVSTSSFAGDGLTISNASNNRVVTSTGGKGLEAESSLTYDPSNKVLEVAAGSIIAYTGSFDQTSCNNYTETPKVTTNKSNLILEAPANTGDWSVNISASNDVNVYAVDDVNVSPTSFTNITSLLALTKMYSQTMTADAQIISSSLGTIINVTPNDSGHAYSLQSAMQNGQLLIVRNASLTLDLKISNSNGGTQNTYFYGQDTRFDMKPYQSIIFAASGSGELFWLHVANSTSQFGGYA